MNIYLIIKLVAIATVIPELLTSIFGISHKNKILNILLKVVTCRKCFSFWLTLIITLNLPLACIVCVCTILLEKIILL
jgi:hypothetical protein